MIIMKTNRILLSIFILVAVVLVVLFRGRPKQSAALAPTQETVQPTNPVVGKSGVALQSAPHAPSATPPTNQKQPAAINPRSPEGFRQYVEEQNKPIEFYGQIIDQNSNPVPDVKVKIGIRHWTMPNPAILQTGSKEIHLEQTSDVNGRFEFHGETGDGFGVGITKDGYLLPPNARYGFGPQAGTFATPVIFKMWKIGESQQLISHSLSRIGIPVDGQPVQFDLFNGIKVSSGGQLIVRFERNPQSLPPGDAGYDWNASFEIPNGGLAANNDEFMYQAPEGGYQETYKVEMAKSATNWTATLDQQFYIKLDNGKFYGNLTVHLPTFHDTPPIGLTLGITINPNGSRNLQP